MNAHCRWCFVVSPTFRLKLENVEPWDTFKNTDDEGLDVAENKDETYKNARRYYLLCKEKNSSVEVGNWMLEL